MQQNTALKPAAPVMPQGDRKNATAEAMSGLLDRLEAALTEENDILEQQKIVPHDSFAARKNQVLREIMTLQRQAIDSPVVLSMADRLQHVRKLVDRNFELLKVQVSAMTEVTSLLTNVALAEEADGTYSRQGQ